MQSSSVQSYQPLRAGELRTLSLASLGGALEFYDFVIFVFFTAVIGKLFFPASMPEWIRQLQTYGIFAAGYLARPLGGIVMAHFGDLRGRKNMFMLSVLLMAIPTLTIGLLPTYQTIGPGAPLLLLVMRVLQGMAIGGEAPGGWVFVAEHARRGQLGFAVGLLTCGLTCGILLGSVVATGLTLAFTQTQIAHGLWRFPFILGGAFGIIAMFLRRWLDETPVFEEMRRRATISRELPLRAVLRGHRRAIAVSMISTWMLTAMIVVIILMTPSLLVSVFRLPPHSVQLANLAGTAGLCLSTVVVGGATDRFGIRRVAIPLLLFLIAATYALYVCAQRAPSHLWIAYVFAGIGTGGAALTPIVMVRAFPAAVRFTGVSFSYNLAYAVFGGITPLFVAWLTHLNPLAPAHYIAAITALGLIVTWMAGNSFAGEISASDL
jgi:MFS family permease